MPLRRIGSCYRSTFSLSEPRQQAAAAVEAQLAETGEELAVAQVSTLKRYLWGFTATNTFVAILFFVLCSLAVKSLSVSARTTPLRWPN